MTRFQRPPGPLNVWKVIDGYEEQKDGKKTSVKFSIQEVPNTEERRKEVIELFCEHFLNDEVINKSRKLMDDPDGIEDLKILWNYGINQELTVGCYKLDPEGKIGELVGGNIMYTVSEETEKDFDKFRKEDFKSDNFKIIYDYMLLMYENADIKKIYGVKEYLSSISLCVNPAFRGQKLGVHILDARREIGKKYGFNVTSTMFTGPQSQLQAKRAGFEDTYSADYTNAIDDKGNPLFPDIQSKCVKIMSMTLP